MYLYPDLDTLNVFPWRPQQGKVARLICDVYRPNREPFEGDPRYILKKSGKSGRQSLLISLMSDRNVSFLVSYG